MRSITTNLVTLGLAASLSLVCTPPAAGGVGPSILGPRTDLPTPAGPNSIVVADFDDDGRNDVAVACTSADKVAIFFGTGNGGFAPRVDLSLGPQPSRLAIGDWNHDDKTDLAVALGGASPQVLILLGNGTRTLTAGPTAAIPAHSTGLRFGDFTGDGLIDLAGGLDQAPTCVFVLPGTAGGAFGALVPVTPPGDPAATCAAIGSGDLDGNTTADLVVLRRCETCSSFLYYGVPGSHGSLSHISHPGGAAVFYDMLNRQPGIFVASTAEDSTHGQLSLFRNGTAIPEATIPLPAPPSGITSADFDSSGSIDAAVAHPGTNSVSLVRFDCLGAFSDTQSYDTGAGPVDVASGDLDGDGRPDLVTANAGAGSISLRLGVATVPRCRSSAIQETSSLDFGAGSQFALSILYAYIRSGGPAALHLTGWTSNNPEFTTVVHPSAGIPPGSVMVLEVRYLRNTLGTATGTITIGTDDPLHSGIPITLSGSAGVPPHVVIDPLPPAPTLRTGDMTVLTIHLHNPSDYPLNVQTSLDSVRMTGPPSYPEDPGPPLALPHDLLDATGFRWDIQPDGSIETGSDQAFLGGMLRVGLPGSSPAVVDDEYRTTAFGPVSAAGFFLGREVFVSPDAGFARWLEIVENPSTEKKTYKVDVLTNFGGPLTPPQQGASWVVLQDGDDTGGRPAVAQVFGATRAPSSTTVTNLPPQTRFKWDLAVGPYGRAAVAHFAVQAGTAAAAATTAQQLAQLGGGALDGLGSTDRRLLLGSFPVDAFLGGEQFFVMPPGASRSMDITLGATMFLGLPVDVSAVLHFDSNDPVHPSVSVPIQFHVVALEDTAGAPVVVAVQPTQPGKLALRGFLPNPISGTSGGVIALSLASDAPATCSVYDVRGRMLWRRDLTGSAAGPSTVRVSAREIPGRGMVWLRLVQGGHAVTQKGILLP